MQWVHPGKTYTMLNFINNSTEKISLIYGSWGFPHASTTDTLFITRRDFHPLSSFMSARSRGIFTRQKEHTPPPPIMRTTPLPSPSKDISHRKSLRKLCTGRYCHTLLVRHSSLYLALQGMVNHTGDNDDVTMLYILN